MKTTIRTAISILTMICLTGTVLLGSIPNATAATDAPDPIVLSEKQTVPKGNPFQATFDFLQLPDCSKPDKITISVSSPNNAISIAKKSFTYDEENNISEIDDKYELDADATDIEYNFNYRLTIPEKYLKRITDGAGTLKFTINYYEDGKKLDTFTVQKTVFDSNGTSSDSTEEGVLSVSSYSVDHSPVKEGEKFGLTFIVKNNGNAVCNNVMVVLDVSGAEGVSINGVTDTQYISSLEAGSSYTITYPMTCLTKMKTNSYAVGITLSADELEKATSSKIYVPITGTKTDENDTGTVGSSKPQIIIESYDYGGTAVTGGKEFLLTMNIKNTGATAIENVKMTVSSTVDSTADTDTGGAFTPAKSSNTFFISKLNGGAVIKEQIALLPKSDAAPKSYGVGIAFKYEAVLDSKRESLEAQETISIPLTQPDRFEVNDAEVPGPMYLGEPGQLNINYVNKGKSKIFNLSVKLAGNFTTGEANSYIGNIDSGTGDSFQATLNPSAEGTLTGSAVFSYEDANGVTKTLTKEFSCDVMTMQDGSEGMNPEPAIQPEVGNSPPTWPYWLGGGVVVVAAIITLRIVHKKKKAKKLRMLEESDDYYDSPNGVK